MFSDYDRWKLATPPEYEWQEGQCEDCGGWFNPATVLMQRGCHCHDEPEYPDPDELAEMIDAAQEGRDA